MVEKITLEEYYKGDPGLLAFYKKRLLIRGWQPHMNAMEREYVRRMNPPWYAANVEKARKNREEHGDVAPKIKAEGSNPPHQEA